MSGNSETVRVGFQSWYLFQVGEDEMAGSLVAEYWVGSGTVLPEREELRDEKQ